MARPTKMTEETLKKLEAAYLSDATHLEACIYAGISEPTLHAYRNKHPEFSKRIDAIRGLTNLKAKNLLRESIEEGDKYDAKWWLERRDPDFKPKKETDVNLNPHEDFVKMLIEKKGCKG